MFISRFQHRLMAFLSCTFWSFVVGASVDGASGLLVVLRAMTGFSPCLAGAVLTVDVVVSAGFDCVLIATDDRNGLATRVAVAT